MRIVNIMQGTHLGGTEHASLRLMLALKERGHSFEVISLTPIGTLGPVLQEHGIPARGFAYGGRGGWRDYFTLRRALASVQADALLMTGNNLMAMLALGALCRGRRVLAVHFHHTGVKPAWQWRLIYRTACSRFPAGTFPSDFIRAEAETLYPPVKPLARTVRNPLQMPALPSEKERASDRRALGLPEDAPVIGNAGWLIPRKRFDVFLRVAQKVLLKLPNAVFVIAGDGEERAKLERLAGELNIAGNVKWLGWQKDLSLFYPSLDVLLFNSDWDAMGLSPLEAAGYGVPVVASVEHGGLNEMVINDGHGFLLPAHDIAALAEKTVYFIKNKEKARAAALACRARIAELCDAGKIAQEIEAMFKGPPNA